MFPNGFMIMNPTGTVRKFVDSEFKKQLQRIEGAVQDPGFRISALDIEPGTSNGSLLLPRDHRRT